MEKCSIKFEFLIITIIIIVIIIVVIIILCWILIKAV